MDKYQIQKLRELPIEGVAERLGLHVSHHKSLCPFHEDHHASLSFNLRRNTFRCFVCDAGGGTIDLVMRRLALDFPNACRWLADTHNVILDKWQPAAIAADKKPPTFDPTRYLRHFEHPWLSDQARRFLFEERRLSPAVVSWCRLTSWQDRHGTHWLQIPYYDTTGRLIGLQNRNLDYHRSPTDHTDFTDKSKGGADNSNGKAEQPRFRFPYGARCSIYNLPVIPMLRPEEPLFITEGASDCWAMLSAGHKAVAIPSATLLSTEDKLLLQTLAADRRTTFHMYPDRDLPGERLFLQLRQVLPTLVHHQLPPDCKDFADHYLATLRQ